MSDRFIDFDAMWAESMPKDDNRPRVRVFGEEVILPTTLPARIMLKAMRGGADKQRTFGETLSEFVADLVTFFGEERVQRWIDNGIEPTQLIDIYTHVISLYTPKRDEDDEGNPPAPEEGATTKKAPSKRSSKSGR